MRFLSLVPFFLLSAGLCGQVSGMNPAGFLEVAGLDRFHPTLFRPSEPLTLDELGHDVGGGVVSSYLHRLSNKDQDWPVPLNSWYYDAVLMTFDDDAKDLSRAIGTYTDWMRNDQGRHLMPPGVKHDILKDLVLIKNEESRDSFLKWAIATSLELLSQARTSGRLDEFQAFKNMILDVFVSESAGLKAIEHLFGEVESAADGQQRKKLSRLIEARRKELEKSRKRIDDWGKEVEQQSVTFPALQAIWRDRSQPVPGDEQALARQMQQMHLGSDDIAKPPEARSAVSFWYNIGDADPEMSSQINKLAKTALENIQKGINTDRTIVDLFRAILKMMPKDSVVSSVYLLEHLETVHLHRSTFIVIPVRTLTELLDNGFRTIQLRFGEGSPILGMANKLDQYDRESGEVYDRCNQELRVLQQLQLLCDASDGAVSLEAELAKIQKDIDWLKAAMTTIKRHRKEVIRMKRNLYGLAGPGWAQSGEGSSSSAPVHSAQTNMQDWLGSGDLNWQAPGQAKSKTKGKGKSKKRY